LQSGIRAFDGDSQAWFNLRGHLCLITADRMGMQKIMAMSGPNGKLPCPYCTIKGIWSSRNRHYYYPLTLPSLPSNPSETPLLTNRPQGYDANNLPLRRTLKELIHHVCAASDQRLFQDSGVAGLSIFTELNSVQWPKSFCIDTMHLVLENTSVILYKLWSGGFVAEGTDAPDYVLSKKVWEEIGEEMNAARPTIPTSFGRPPRSIFRHCAGFKAVEWWNFLAFFAVPILTTRLPSKYVKNLMLLNRAHELLTQFSVFRNDIISIRSLLIEFVQSYEELYYRYTEDNLPMLTSTIHTLLHLADCVESCGPAWVYWAFPMKRVNGMLLSLIKSRVRINESLANGIILQENLYHLQYRHPQASPDLYRSLLGPRNYLNLPDDLGQLLGPTKMLKAVGGTLVGLKQYYQTRYNLTILQLSVYQISSSFQRWARLQLPDERNLVGSKVSQRLTEYNRASHLIRYTLSNGIDDEDVEIVSSCYGQVEYFAVCNFNHEDHYLAYIHCYDNIQHEIDERSGIVTVTCGELKRYQWISVKSIECIIGIFETGGIRFIIDKYSFTLREAMSL
jgi:hypothetical protein